MSDHFNKRLKQFSLLLIIVLLAILLLKELFLFLPGFLGAITLYILSRKWYMSLVTHKKWNKGVVAFLFIIGAMVVIAIPVYLSIVMVSPKISSLLNNQQEVIQGIQILANKFENLTGIKLFSDENTRSVASTISGAIPGFLNGTANLLINLIMLFFLLYYLLVNGPVIEKYLNNVIPLKPENVEKLTHETVLMIKANAIGIPVICFVQGIFAAVGYLIFGVKDWGLWGFVTGVFAFFPLVGTMIVWVPLVIYIYSTGDSSTAIWLTLYSIIVTGNVDYVARLGLLKKMGNVHPVITALGVIVGLQLFGFMGLIFGPLLISYVIVLIKIYMNEFVKPAVINNVDI